MKIDAFDLDARVMVVAEIGNNHEGSCVLAEELIGLAARAGADAVKFQTIVPEKLVSQSQEQRLRQLRKFQLSRHAFESLQRVAHREGLLFLSTPFDLDSVAFLDGLVPAFKIASSDNTFRPLLAAVARTGKPVLMSTGLADSEQIGESLRYINSVQRKHGIRQGTVLLHCVTSYPTPSGQASLLAIRYLRERFGLTVGYSDHTLGIAAAVLSVGVGARVVEKHFTVDKHRSDFRDHQLSADPTELKEMIEKIRAAEQMLGRYGKELQECELPLVDALRRSIVASRNLECDHVLSSDDVLWVRVPGGWSPADDLSFVGRALQSRVRSGDPIRPEMLVER